VNLIIKTEVGNGILADPKQDEKTLIRNKELIKKINNALSKGNIEFVLAHLADDIQWNIVGMPSIRGKNDFLKTMEIMEIESSLNINVKNVIAEGDYVVIESRDETNSRISFSPAFCDVYRIKNGKIQELTTYVVDTTLNNESINNG